jgi:hypothetical protein
MKPLPTSALVRVVASGLRGRVWARYHRAGQRTPYAYLVKLETGEQVECGRDELEVAL